MGIWCTLRTAIGRQTSIFFSVETNDAIYETGNPQGYPIPDVPEEKPSFSDVVNDMPIEFLAFKE